MTSFDALLEERNAAAYADFLLPHLRRDSRVLDLGCGTGTITIGLAEAAGAVVGVDTDDDEFGAARRYAVEHRIRNVEFSVGNAYALEFPDGQFDACLCHSVLEALERPLDAVVEIKRTLKPGGVLAVASVEYGGIILGGPHADPLGKFYSVREQVWLLDRAADPYAGRNLRGLLADAGYNPVEATSKYFSYGTPQAVRKFGLARAEDCTNTWYARSAEKHGLATAEELEAMSRAWVEWSESPGGYAAFSWCRALGWKPAP